MESTEFDFVWNGKFPINCKNRRKSFQKILIYFSELLHLLPDETNKNYR